MNKNRLSRMNGAGGFLLCMASAHRQCCIHSAGTAAAVHVIGSARYSAGIG